jgi:hypothetical protein
LISTPETCESPAELSAGDLPDAPEDRDGTEFAEWKRQGELRQEAYARSRVTYREQIGRPMMPVEQQKPGRPR